MIERPLPHWLKLMRKFLPATLLNGDAMAFKPLLILPKEMEHHPMLRLLKARGAFDSFMDPVNTLMLPTDEALAKEMSLPRYVDHYFSSYIDGVYGELDRIWGKVNQRSAQEGDTRTIALIEESVHELCNTLRAAIVNGDLIPGDLSRQGAELLEHATENGSFLLLFQRLPDFDLDVVLSAISRLEPSLTGNVTVAAANDGVFRFGKHAFKLSVIDTPYPANEIASVIDRTNWAPEAKVTMRQHRAFIECRYAGDDSDPTEQIVAVLNIAVAFLPYGLLGVARVDAGVCIPTKALPLLIQPEILADARRSIPIGVWTGFEQFEQSDGQIWFRTRGFHLWDKPDLAYLGSATEASIVQELFGTLLTYMRNNKTLLHAGESASIGDRELDFRAAPPEITILQGPHQIITVEFTNRSTGH
jgi:hypothetical protein